MLGRVGLALVAAFLVFWAVGWGREEYGDGEDAHANAVGVKSTRRGGLWRRTLIRFGPAGYVGTLGLLIGWVAVSGQGWEDWAARAASSMVLLLGAVGMSAGCGLALLGVVGRGAMGKYTPIEAKASDLLEASLAEGPGQAMLNWLAGRLPRRVQLVLGAAGFGAAAYLLLSWTVAIAAGESAMSVELPGWAAAASLALDLLFVLGTAVLVLSLLLLGVVSVVARDFSGAGILLLVAAIVVGGLFACYWLGLLDGQMDSLSELWHWLRG